MNKNVLLIGNFLSGSMVTRHVCEDMAHHLGGRGWNTINASTKLARLPKMVDMVATTWRCRDQYAVAHIECYSGMAFAWAEWVAWTLQWLGKPFILTLHSGNFPSFARQWPRRVRSLFRRAAVVTTPSGYLQEHMQPYRRDLRLLPNALDLSKYSYRPRAALTPRLLWLRGFLDYYNPLMGPRVVAALAKEFPDIHLAMVGPDKGDSSLEQTRRLARQLGVEDKVSFPGGVPKADIPRWMDQHDIFINTTNRDNTPVSVMEAMASGLNVVSTNVDGLPYLVAHGTDGLLVAPDDAEAMAQAIARLLRNPAWAAGLAGAARQKVAAFDWSRVLPQWEAIYRELSSSGVSHQVVGRVPDPASRRMTRRSMS